MPNHVSIHCEDKRWKAYVFTDREGDDWGKYLCHDDIDPPNIRRLAFVAHHDEIMALLNSDDYNGALRSLVMVSFGTMEAKLRAEFNELRKEKTQ